MTFFKKAEPMYIFKSLRDTFEEEKCDDTKYYVTFCSDYYDNPIDCPKTCYYAREQDKKIMNDRKNEK